MRWCREEVKKTGLAEVPLRDRIALLSDNGPGYLSRVFHQYLRISSEKAPTVMIEKTPTAWVRDDVWGRQLRPL